MLETDVIDQLGRYGAWVEQHEGIELRPSARGTGRAEATTVQLEVIQHRRPWWVLAVAVLAVVGLIGAGWVASQSGSSSTAFLASDPPGALFVLPDADSGFSFKSASVETFAAPDLFTEMVVFGEADGEVIRNLNSASVVRERPQLAPNDSWVDVETAVGTAQHASTDFMTMVTRRSGGWWIVVTTGPGRLEEALRVVDGVALTAQGSIDISSDLSGQVIERIKMDHESDLTATYADVESADPDEALVVETATAPSPLTGVGVLDEEISETTVRDLSAWQLTRNDADGEWNGIAWLASPNRIIAVSGHAPIETIRRLAESLNPVDEELWRNETGNEAD